MDSQGVTNKLVFSSPCSKPKSMFSRGYCPRSMGKHLPLPMQQWGSFLFRNLPVSHSTLAATLYLCEHVIITSGLLSFLSFGGSDPFLRPCSSWAVNQGIRASQMLGFGILPRNREGWRFREIWETMVGRETSSFLLLKKF